MNFDKISKAYDDGFAAYHGNRREELARHCDEMRDALQEQRDSDEWDHASEYELETFDSYESDYTTMLTWYNDDSLWT